jgi:hypothetical protein
MRSLILALGLVAAALPAPAETIQPGDAKAHVGKTVTILATVAEVKTGRGGVTFLDMGGSFPDNAFAAVIFASDLAKFPAPRRSRARPSRSAARWCSTMTGRRSFSRPRTS